MRSAAVMAVCLCLGACTTGSGSGPSHSPKPVAAASPTQTASSPSTGATANPAASPSALASPKHAPVTGSYGVLAGPFTGSNYNIALVEINGKIAGSAVATTPPSPTCAGRAAGLVPYPISTSDDVAYFMDAKGAVRTLDTLGTIAPAPVLTLPIGPNRRSVFAASPDDSRMAVAVIDFVAGGANTKLYVDQLGSPPAQNPIFTESGSYTVWPIGWHGGNLVVAKVPSCTQGGGPGCCGPQELHVVDAATAVRKSTVGGSGCVIVGASTPGGAMCENSAFTAAYVVSWTGAKVTSYPINGPVGAYLSPDGNRVALVDNAGTSVPGSNVTWQGLLACGWIDESHVFSGGDQLQQPRVGEFPDAITFPVAAQGDCAGRIPGGL